ncbi:9009_t:CDS:2 [Funneliformis mosseae]|uniref:9009_t:CDS:1 n=1 Tax=Funneliformis mosseae TaxID=27381 RepID=A0A9N9AZW9_FUNMO|nr:9009_t:CDS:2 [Funneliformis mosseae]
MNNKYFNDIKLRIKSSLKVEHAINEVISCRNGFDILYMENLGLDDESEDNKKHLVHLQKELRKSTKLNTGERPYVCTIRIVEKGIVDWNSMKDHVRTHDEKPDV